MANLRLLQIKVLDSVTIKAKFSADLDPFIDKACVVITSNVEGVPDPSVLEISIFKQVITITTQPMTPLASYTVTFKSTDTSVFKSKDGTFFILEDGTTNAPLISGPEDPANPVRDFLIDYLKESPYNLAIGDLSRDIINSQANNIAKALYAVRQAKNDNYLSVTIHDELKTRGDGPFDRLNEEGAFEVIRVGKKKAGATTSTIFNYDEFPDTPISLLRGAITSEALNAGSGESTFAGLVLTVAKNFVIKLNRIIINYDLGGSFEYDLDTLGYQILNSRYDENFASSLITLGNNQFKLNDSVLLDSDFTLPGLNDTVIVDYEYIVKGRIVSEDSVTVTQVLDAIREVTPPISSDFTLNHVPVVTSGDIIPTLDGVIFLDPEANPPFSETHPAFLNEIPFRFEALPSQPGEYCIDYENSRVFVYGAETNDGTGDFPPVATYKYRKTFSSRLDYTYDPETYELVANPLRDLAGQEAKISFDYELTLVPDIDYKAQVHQEILDERIENRLKSTVSLAVLNTPITNVFRIYNESSGEVYRINRWNDDTIFFTSNIPPNILSINRERIAFNDVLNELLLVNDEFNNILGTRIFKINLENNNIISASEDSIGASFNSSATFSRTDIFQTELYFDGQVLSPSSSYNRLEINQYQIDYKNGIIYLGVESDQNFDVGTINYKKPTIKPTNSHLISVSELYHSINNISGINKKINYLNFGEGFITPATFDLADERFTDGDITDSYLVVSDTITVTDNIKNVRGIYDEEDLTTNTAPTNFADGVSVSGNIITLNSDGVEKQETLIIQSGLELEVSFIGDGAEIASVTSITRISDNISLGVTSFSDYTIQLSGTGSPIVGQEVLVNYKVKLNGAATPIVDYDRGDYFADYTYLVDEILVSYEYGDNRLDFRESNTVDPGDTYFVTYRVGALRDSLLKNFGTLVDLPILNTFDTTLPRENYRDALQAALQSFTKGPTVPAIKQLVSNITHIDPEIVEGAFENWSLGVSHLYPSDIEYTGDIQLLSSKFDNGVLIANSDETITFPVSSNLRLEEGSLELWVTPEWDGLDNDAILTFSDLNIDGYAATASQIFIGADSHNPTIIDGVFTINRLDEASPLGLPSAIFTDVGLFIYYDDEAKLWKVLARDSLTSSHIYEGKITSSGEVYNVNWLPGLGEINDVKRSTSNKIEFVFNLDGNDSTSPDGYNDGYSITDGYSPGDGYVAGFSFDGISFMADEEHYLFDFGKTEKTNRFSLYKDGSGYLNFRVFDSGQRRISEHKISADISDWAAGEKHHIGISWKLNTSDRRDEMHLFLDGEEVPNIMQYGGRPISIDTDRFRTVKPEVLVGVIPLNTVTAQDLNTTLGSSIVISDSINFSAAGIAIGNTISIKETGFAASYTITNVSGTSLTLNTTMPATLDDARFSINPYSTVVSSEIDLFSNIAVSIIDTDTEEETEIPGLRADLPGYEISKDAQNRNILTILGSASVGDSIVIRTLGRNHRRCRDRVFVWGNTTNILKTHLPPPINLDEVKIFPILLPLYIIGPDNSTLSVGRFTSDPITTSQPSNASEGRTLAVRVTGGNVNFSDPVEVTINGTTQAGPIFETLTFSQAEIQNTSNKFKTITSVVVETTPLVTTKNSVGVEIKEAYSITYSEGNNIYPVIRFSYKTQLGTTLQGDGSSTVTDSNGYFPASTVGQLLVISSPVGVAGTYTIASRVDNNTVTLTPTPASSFSGGTYSIFNVTIGRSGFQNGYFVLEQAGATNVAFPLKQGYFDFDYSAYLEIPFEPVSDLTAFVGSDLNGENQAKAVLDEFRILSIKMTDVRVGESIADNQESFTTDFTALRPFVADSDTLMLLHLDELPLLNSAKFWKTANKEFLQSGESVNANFDKSLVVTTKPIIVDNAGLLSTASEGSIEFWVSPRYDTYNDPNFRFYFDATGNSVEEVTSLTSSSIKISGRISEVISVRLANDRTGNGTDYFIGGRVESDFKTIKLGKQLPYQQTPVIVNYIPSGLVGNRLSIYKDQEGFIVFNVRAKKNEQMVDYQVRQPVFWARDSWHRVRVTYKFNRPDNEDEIRLFVDGEERGTLIFGTGLLFGPNIIFGQGFAGVNNSILTGDINFNDPINQFFIGSDYLKNNTAQARIDNLRISNSSRVPYTLAGQPRDVNFTSNIDAAYPVVEDVFTTYLLNFDTLISLNEDFALLKDEQYGIFNFGINIIDSFDIVLSNDKIKQILETLISALKPAQAKVTLNYFQ